MSKKTHSPDAFAQLAPQVQEALLTQAPSVMPSPSATSRMFKHVQQRIGESGNDQYFVFAEQGKWRKMGPGITVKMLHQQDQGRSMLLKLEAEASIGAHRHTLNEETLVLSGEVWLDGIHCRPGDYHFSKAGTAHKNVWSREGCTLLVKTFAG